MDKFDPKFHGSEGVWIDTTHNTGVVTSSTVILHHEGEVVAQSKNCVARIAHVRGWNGKGFTVRIYTSDNPWTVEKNHHWPHHGGSFCETIIYGTSIEHLQKAFVLAGECVAQRQKYFDEKQIESETLPSGSIVKLK